MKDSYAGLSSHYDIVMASGYYDYTKYSTAILELSGQHREFLELGVGTGLVCERLLALSSNDLRITGIDHSGSMLTQARQRLGARVRLEQQDVLHLELPQAFDVAYCVGGVWGYTRDQDDIRMASLLASSSEDLRALANVRNCLKPGGMLLLAVQRPHAAERRQLPNGLVYRQEVRVEDEGRLVKDYWVTDQETIVAHQQSSIRIYGEEQARNLLAQCGLHLERISPDGLFALFRRA